MGDGSIGVGASQQWLNQVQHTGQTAFDLLVLGLGALLSPDSLLELLIRLALGQLADTALETLDLPARPLADCSLRLSIIGTFLSQLLRVQS